MVMGETIIVFGILQLLGIVVAVAILKNDLKWIKRELRRGSDKFREHSGKIESIQTALTTLETKCKLRHGTGE